MTRPRRKWRQRFQGGLLVVGWELAIVLGLAVLAVTIATLVLALV